MKRTLIIAEAGVNHNGSIELAKKYGEETSKSFVNVLWQLTKCCLYPGTKSAVCSSTKQQSAKILTQKTDEILSMIPAFKFELK